MSNIETMKLALEALERNDYLGWQVNKPVIKALRQAIEQSEKQEQDPLMASLKNLKQEVCDAVGEAHFAPNQAIEQAQHDIDWEKLYRLEVKKKEAIAAKYEQDIKPLTKIVPMAQQAEPVVWMYQNKSTHEVRFQKHMRSFVDHGAWYEVPLYSEPLANQEKTSGSPTKQVLAQQVEPVAWLNPYGGVVQKRMDGHERTCYTIPLYTSPPPRQPLTIEKIDALYESTESVNWGRSFARAIEAAHGIKEKNT
jgi:hypothetical protein